MSTFKAIDSPVWCNKYTITSFFPYHHPYQPSENFHITPASSRWYGFSLGWYGWWYGKNHVILYYSTHIYSSDHCFINLLCILTHPNSWLVCALKGITLAFNIYRVFRVVKKWLISWKTNNFKIGSRGIVISNLQKINVFIEFPKFLALLQFTNKCNKVLSSRKHSPHFWFSVIPILNWNFLVPSILWINLYDLMLDVQNLPLHPVKL